MHVLLFEGVAEKAANFIMNTCFLALGVLELVQAAPLSLQAQFQAAL